MFGKVIRLKKIKFSEFKNIKSSSIEIENDVMKSVTGIYGANGSGKTAVIDAIDVLKQNMTGKVAEFPYYYINVDASKSKLTYFLSYTDFQKRDFDIEYTLEYVKNDRSISFSKENFKIYNDNFSFKFVINRNAKNIKKAILVNDSEFDDGMFDIDELTKMFYVNVSNSSSIVFGGIGKCLRAKYEWLNNILLDFNRYAEFQMFVIKMRETSLISASDKIYFHVSVQDENYVTVGTQVCNLLGTSEITKNNLPVFKQAIEQCNEILSVIIPDFRIVLFEIPGVVMNSQNEECVNVSFFSMRSENNEPLPLVFESEGIKKIISIVSSLISCYNNTSTLVAIDEFDAGIYEYLLGQLIQTISLGGKGQLIFTSHNLRVLEVIDVNSIVFSTLNPKNRFVKFRNCKPTNNLRSLYIRALQLGGQKEEFYIPMDSVDLKIAFKQANIIGKKEQ